MTTVCPLCGTPAANLPSIAVIDHALYINGKFASGIRGLTLIMFEELYKQIGEVVSRDFLFYKMYPVTADFDRIDRKVLDVRVCKLRRELEKLSLPFSIETVWGFGYKMRWINEQ